MPKGGHGTESVANLEYINAAMLQSQEGFLRLFPAWPNKRAKFVGLRTQGAFLVSSELDHDEVSYVEIYSEKGKNCSVLNPWPGYSATIVTSDNRQVDFSFSGNKIDFSTQAGESYTLSNSGIPIQQASNSEDDASIRMGDQIWLTKNLDVSTFRNGDPIPEMKTDEEWEKAGQDQIPAWCYYDNNPSAAAIHGKLYNAYAILDPRGLAPEGYHVATDLEWIRLASYLGGRDTAGLEMKNDRSFGAAMGGFRNKDGKFYGMGVNGYWWSSTVLFQDVMWDMVLNHKNSVVFRDYSKQQDGLYVRCVRD